ncbi:MAG: hypothetical protein AAF346_00180 [Pseudomonadota bacterium]
MATTRKKELSEYRFYYAILIPVCLVSAFMARVTKLFQSSKPRHHQEHKTVWTAAHAQANTIIPFIMMR